MGGTPGGTWGANKNSPDFQHWSPLSVQDQTQKFQVKSRVETILEKAKQQNTAKHENTKSCDVIESAQKLGIAIWLLPKIILWIESLKSRIGNFDKLVPKPNPNSATSNKRKRSAGGFDQDFETRTLKVPFIKYDDVNHECRPVLCEFRRFPKIYCGGRAGQSPFFSPEASFVKTQKLREFPERKLAEKSLQAPPQVKKTTTPIQHTKPHQANKVNHKAPQAQGGYCEICEAPFSELEGHIVSKVHIARVGLSHLWTKLDSCIDQVNKTGTSEDDLDQDLDQSVM